MTGTSSSAFTSSGWTFEPSSLASIRRELTLKASGLYLFFLGGAEVAQVPLMRICGRLDELKKWRLGRNRRVGDHGSGSNDTWHKRSGPSRAALELAGKLCIVTGANAGVGLATATELAARGARVIIACRSEERGQAAVRRVRESLQRQGDGGGGGAETMALDLASLESVRSFSQELAAKGMVPQVLVNNAGIMAPPLRSVTADGFEGQWQVNYLSHFLLTQELLAQRDRLPLEVKGSSLRVVNVTSMTHHGGHIFFDDLNFEGKYHPFAAYAQSKLALVLFTAELHRRRPDVTAVSVHPGLVNTELARGFFANSVPKVMRPLLTPLYPHLLKTPEEAVESMMFAITAPPEVVAGRYVADAGVRSCSAKADERTLCAKLWQVSTRLTSALEKKIEG